MSDERPITRAMIDVGYEGRTYAAGDLANAVDEVVCWFMEKRKISRTQAIATLGLYIEHLREEGSIDE